MPCTDPAERRLSAQIAANTSWAKTPDRSARTAPARAGLFARFLIEANGDPQAAECLYKAHFQRLALKSARNRRLAREHGAAAESADAELAAIGGASA